jgi:hypothetical protein
MAIEYHHRREVNEMTDSCNKIAIDALQLRARELIVERDDTRRQLLAVANRDAQIERDIFGCIAGARALGTEIDVSGGVSIPAPKQGLFNQFLVSRTQIAALYPQLRVEFGIEDDNADWSDAIDDSGPEMPRIAEIIFEQLKAAGDDGSKAADIRRYIFRTYKSDIHEKTVGMTLNRMQAAGQVRRDGRSWYLVQTKEVAS